MSDWIYYLAIFIVWVVFVIIMFFREALKDLNKDK